MQEYEASAKRKREESRALVEGAGSDFMKNLGHVQRIELLHGLNDMTSELKSFLVIINLCFIVLWNVSLNCCWFWSLFSLLDKTDLCPLSNAFFSSLPNRNLLVNLGGQWQVQTSMISFKISARKGGAAIDTSYAIDKLHLLIVIFKISKQRSKPISIGIVWGVNTAFCTRSFTAPSLLHSKGFKHETATPVSCRSLLWSWSHKQARNSQALAVILIKPK